MKIAQRIFLLLLLLCMSVLLSSCGCSAGDDKVEKSGTTDLSSSVISENFSTTGQQMNSKSDNGKGDEVNKDDNSVVNSDSENNSLEEKSTSKSQVSSTSSKAETGGESAVSGDLNREKTTSAEKSLDKTEAATSEEQREDNAQVNFYDLL